MKTIKAIIASLALFAMFAGTSAQAKVEIQWWHAFGGRLGELLDEQVNKFNASQANTLLFILEKVITQKLLTLVSLHSELDNIRIFLWYLKLEQQV